ILRRHPTHTLFPYTTLFRSMSSRAPARSLSLIQPCGAAVEAYPSKHVTPPTEPESLFAALTIPIARCAWFVLSVIGAPAACVAAVVPSKPRVTVQVYGPVPVTFVTLTSSLSMYARKPVVPGLGKPVFDATVIVVAVVLVTPEDKVVV